MAGTRVLLQGAKLACSIGGVISLASVARATVIVESNRSRFDALVLAWVERAKNIQDARFEGDKCNQFAVAAYRAAGLTIPDVKRRRLGLDGLARDTPPLAQELSDGSRYNDLLGPLKPIQDASLGDIILWNGDGHHHAAILTRKNGTNPDYWEVTYAGGKGATIKSNFVVVLTRAEGGTTPFARGPRR